jgi:hypothetical protein
VNCQQGLTVPDTRVADEKPRSEMQTTHPHATATFTTAPASRKIAIVNRRRLMASCDVVA